MARQLHIIEVDPQHEVVRNTDHARHLQAGAHGRQIFHEAVDDPIEVEAHIGAEHDAARILRAVSRTALASLYETIR